MVDKPIKRSHYYALLFHQFEFNKNEQMIIENLISEKAGIVILVLMNVAQSWSPYSDIIMSHIQANLPTANMSPQDEQ